jgi:LysM repeat protein
VIDLEDPFLTISPLKNSKKMNDTFNEKLEILKQVLAKDPKYSGNDQTARPPRKRPRLKAKGKTLMLGGIGILLVIILVALLFRSGDDYAPSRDDFVILEARLSQLEAKIKHLEGIERRIGSLEELVRRRPSPLAGIQEMGSPLTEKSEQPTRILDRVEKAAPLTQTPSPTQKKPSSIRKARCHEVRSGETLYRIARNHGITVEELCRHNNISPEQPIHPGQRLIVAPESTQ